MSKSKVTRYYCTLFDKNYLFRGLALYLSLLDHAGNFKLWVLCMDDLTYKVLSKLRLKCIIPINLSEFEDKKLLKVKPTRTPGEYCWTCTPSLPLFLLKRFPEIDLISYFDADLCFYGTPEVIFKEMGDRSIMIIPHRFANRKKLKEKMNGIFNVGMLTFRHDKEGISSLEWWRNMCLEWCYYRFEDGKIGDQKYLDQFPKLFKNVCILRNIGAGVGVWNIRQYKIKRYNNTVYVNKLPLVFFHFADFEIYSHLPFLLSSPLTGYGEISRNREIIYNSYFELIYKAASLIQRSFPNFKYGFVSRANRKYLKEVVTEKAFFLLWKAKNVLSV